MGIKYYYGMRMEGRILKILKTKQFKATEIVKARNNII